MDILMSFSPPTGSSSSYMRFQPSPAGRKGDPRMNKALAAKLDNPSISAYEALIIGGFDYPNADDTGSVDNENISLLQRKNQLARRIRTVKQQQEREAALINLHGVGNLHLTVDEHSTLSSSEVTRQAKSGNTTVQQTAFTSMKLPHDKMYATHSSSSNLRDDNHYSIEQNPRFLQQNQDQQQPTYHAQIQRSRESLSAPPIFGDIGASLPLPMEDVTSTDLQCLEPNALSYEDMHIRDNLSFSSHSQPGSNIAHLQHPLQQHAVGSTLSALNISSVQQQQQQLQQQQPPLIPTMAGNIADGRKAVAMQLFSNEINHVYKKSMLIAGYSAAEISDESPEFINFCLEAWQAESVRLQNGLKRKSQQQQQQQQQQHQNQQQY